MPPTTPKNPRRQAFTLIELLIVVAIIAILAAIAVPNFLEAQTRSKISRSKADLRTLATAIEAYAVDHNFHPISSGINSASDAIEFQNSEMAAKHKFLAPVVTTPVAYITAIPLDIFAINSGEPDVQNGPQPEMHHYFYTNLLIEKRRFGAMPPWAPGGAFDNRLRFLGPWTLWGCGPDGDRTDLSPAKIGGPASTDWELGFYDPSNGTRSNGDLFRSANYSQLGS